MEATDVNIDVAIENVLLKTHSLTGITALKAEQHAALKALLSGRDVLGVLPTGFGKSFIYQLASQQRRRLDVAPPPPPVGNPSHGTHPQSEREVKLSEIVKRTDLTETSLDKAMALSLPRACHSGSMSSTSEAIEMDVFFSKR